MHKSCVAWLYSCTYANTRQTHVVSNWFQYVNAFDGRWSRTCVVIQKQGHMHIECLDTSGYNNYYVVPWHKFSKLFTKQ